MLNKFDFTVMQNFNSDHKDTYTNLLNNYNRNFILRIQFRNIISISDCCEVFKSKNNIWMLETIPIINHLDTANIN